MGERVIDTKVDFLLLVNEVVHPHVDYAYEDLYRDCTIPGLG